MKWYWIAELCSLTLNQGSQHQLGGRSKLSRPVVVVRLVVDPGPLADRIDRGQRFDACALICGLILTEWAMAWLSIQARRRSRNARCQFERKFIELSRATP